MQVGHSSRLKLISHKLDGYWMRQAQRGIFSGCGALESAFQSHRTLLWLISLHQQRKAEISQDKRIFLC